MEGTNYTPVDRSRLELLWKKSGKSLKMEIAFAAIGILTILVAGVILVMLMNRSKQTPPQKITPKKVTPSPTTIPSDTPTPTATPLPTPADDGNASGSAIPGDSTVVQPPPETTVPPESTPPIGL